MLDIDPAKLKLIIPEYGTDQIIGIFTNTLSLSVPSVSPGYVIVTDPKAHNFGDSCYFQGIFTTDGGTTWNDFGAQTPNLTAPNPQFQTVDVMCYTDTTNINIYATNWYDLAHSSSAARTVTYKLYALAKNTMALPLTPLPTNDIILYSSDYNFQKIYLKGPSSFNVSAGTAGGSSVTHNLGYIPKVRAFYSPASSPTQVYSTSQSTIPPTTSPQIETRISTTDVIFFSDQTNAISGVTINGTIDYRIYLDS